MSQKSNEPMIEHKDFVRKITEDDGILYVSFQNHQAYFTLPKGADANPMIDRLEQSRKANEEISFSFGGDMTLISVS